MPQRAYRPARRCPHGGSPGMPRDGTSRDKPTYPCGACEHRRAPTDGNRRYYPAAVKAQAVGM